MCTHAHNDHISPAAEVAATTSAPIVVHPADEPLWRMTYPQHDPDGALVDGDRPDVAGTGAHPRHSPRGVSLHLPEQGLLFSGDTLFSGGPGATGRSYFPTIIASIRDRLLVLPGETVVHAGHGEDTTIRAETPHLAEWVARGY